MTDTLHMKWSNYWNEFGWRAASGVALGGLGVLALTRDKVDASLGAVIGGFLGYLSYHFVPATRFRVGQRVTGRVSALVFNESGASINQVPDQSPLRVVGPPKAIGGAPAPFRAYPVEALDKPGAVAWLRESDLLPFVVDTHGRVTATS